MSHKALPAYQGVEPFLFVSYAHADDALVLPEVRRLQEAGYRVWYDEGINPAEEWPRSISQALLTSKLVLAYLSPQALASKWVLREIGLAVRKEKELLPIYLEPVELPDDLELQIGHVQALHRYKREPDAYFQHLTQQLERIPDIRVGVQEKRGEWIQSQLQAVADVQKSMLPQELPSVPGYSFWAALEPFAGFAGGDLYDFHVLPTGEVLVLVADVTGKGISAAVGMGALTGIITAAVEWDGADLPALVKRINRAFGRRMSEDRIATLLAVALDPKTHRLRAVSAGHGPALIRRQDGPVEDLVPHGQGGPPLSIYFEQTNYQTVTAELKPGDCLVITTDGITEAFSERRDMYGVERLRDLVARTGPDASQLGQTILADAKRFSGRQDLWDDATVVCLSRSLS
jgi:serine phosphatase RsbU (regulator of sigma subunit)